MQTRDFHAYLYGPDRKPLETSLESAKERLEELPGLFFELDGSFAWMQERGNNEIYGILYDAGGRIQYCDLHGRPCYDSVRLCWEGIRSRWKFFCCPVRSCKISKSL